MHRERLVAKNHPDAFAVRLLDLLERGDRGLADRHLESRQSDNRHLGPLPPVGCGVGGTVVPGGGGRAAGLGGARLLRLGPAGRFRAAPNLPAWICSALLPALARATAWR